MKRISLLMAALLLTTSAKPGLFDSTLLPDGYDSLVGVSHNDSRVVGTTIFGTADETFGAGLLYKGAKMVVASTPEGTTKTKTFLTKVGGFTLGTIGLGMACAGGVVACYSKNIVQDWANLKFRLQVEDLKDSFKRY